MKRTFGFVLLLLSIQSGAQELLTLDEAIQRALQNNFDIRLVKNDSAAFALDNKFANAAFLPRVNATSTEIWNKNAQRQTFTDGTERENNDISARNFATSVNLNWTLFDGGRMFITRKRLAELQELGELNVRNQVVNTVSTVIRNYYNIVQAKQQVKAIAEQISINEERVKLADRKLSVGLGSKPELLQATVDLNAQRAAQLRQETLASQLREQLNQLMGQQVSTPYDVYDTIPLNLNMQFGEIASNVEETSPSLQVAKQNIDIARLSVRERKAERWPTVGFNSAYNFNRNNNQAVINPFQPLFSLNRGWNFGFSASIPILNNLNTRRLIKQAELDVEFQELTFQNQRTLLDVNLTNSYKDYQFQVQALKIEEENIELAKENVFIALARFRQGVSTYLELREAQISLSESYNRLIAARYNTKLAETELLRLQGSIIRY